MREVLTRLLGWLIVGFSLVWLIVRAGAPQEEVEDRIQIRAYPVEEPLRFALQGDESTLRLIIWLVAEDWHEFDDVRHTIPYAFDARVWSPEGELLWSQPTFVRARRTLELRANKLRTPTWLEDEPRVISEDRLHHFEIGPALDGAAVFEIEPTFLPEGTRMLAIGFRDGERDRFQAMRVRRGAISDPQRRVERLGPWRWGELPEHWRERIAIERWERLGALPPEEGVVVPTEELLTRFRRVPWEDAPAVAVAMAPGAAAAFNTEGEVVLDFEWWSVDGEGLQPARSFVRIVNWEGTGEVWEATDLSTVGPVATSEEIESVQIALHPDTEGPRMLRVVSTGPELDRSYGDPPRHRLEDDSQWVAPDFRNIEAYRVDRGLGPVRFRVMPEERLRIAMRRRMDPAPLPAFWPPPPLADGSVVWIDELNLSGQLLERHEVALEPVPSAFERYTEVDHGYSARVAEPEARYLVPHPNTAWLEIRGNAAVDVNLRTTTEDAPETIVHPAYELPEDVEFEMTYEPHVRDPWRHRGPVQIDALIEERRLVRIDAQVRPYWPEDRVLRPSTPRVKKRTLPLPRPFELVAEPDRDGDAMVGGRVRLSSIARQVEVRATGRLSIDYRVPPELVGETVHFEIDGRKVPVRLPASAGSLRLDGLGAGPHALRVEDEGHYFAPTRRGAPWQVRRVYRLAPGEELGIDVPPDGRGVSVYPYTLSSTATLSWRLEGKEAGSARPTGLFQGETTSTGQLPLPPRPDGRVVPLSFADPGLRPVEPLYLSLRDDIPEEGARLFLRISPDQEAWVRILTSWARPVPGRGTHWPMGQPHVVLVDGEAP